MFSDDTDTWWKIPKIQLPKRFKRNLWASNFSLYGPENHNRLVDLFDSGSDDDFQACHMHPIPAEYCFLNAGRGGTVDFGVKSCRKQGTGEPTTGGKRVEQDHRIRMPLHSVADLDAQGNRAIFMEWDTEDRENALTRYIRTTNEVVGRFGSCQDLNPGQEFEVHWCEFVTEEQAGPALGAAEYESHGEVGAHYYRGGEEAFGGDTVDEAAAVRRIPVGDHGNGAAVDSIESAFYGSADGTIRGADVTDSLKALVTRCFGARSRVGAAEGEDPNTVWLQPSDTFNCSVSVPERADPAPGQGKRLVVTDSCGGHNKEISALEHETLGLTLSSIFADKLASSSAGDRQVTLEDGA